MSNTRCSIADKNSKEELFEGTKKQPFCGKFKKCLIIVRQNLNGADIQILLTHPLLSLFLLTLENFSAQPHFRREEERKWVLPNGTCLSTTMDVIGKLITSH